MIIELFLYTLFFYQRGGNSSVAQQKQVLEPALKLLRDYQIEDTVAFLLVCMVKTGSSQIPFSKISFKN